MTQNNKNKARLYAAYGSNMDRDQLIGRCPQAVCLGSAYLDGWELTMPFYANIEPAEGKRTPLLLWEITPSDEASLDQYEGYPRLYEKENVTVNFNGSQVSAMVYVMTENYRHRSEKPRDGYEEQILRAYKNEGFSAEEYQPHRY